MKCSVYFEEKRNVSCLSLHWIIPTADIVLSLLLVTGCHQFHLQLQRLSADKQLFSIHSNGVKGHFLPLLDH